MRTLVSKVVKPQGGVSSYVLNTQISRVSSLSDFEIYLSTLHPSTTFDGSTCQLALKKLQTLKNTDSAIVSNILSRTPYLSPRDLISLCVDSSFLPPRQLLSTQITQSLISELDYKSLSLLFTSLSRKLPPESISVFAHHVMQPDCDVSLLSIKCLTSMLVSFSGLAVSGTHKIDECGLANKFSVALASTSNPLPIKDSIKCLHAFALLGHVHPLFFTRVSRDFQSTTTTTTTMKEHEQVLWSCGKLNLQKDTQLLLWVCNQLAAGSNGGFHLSDVAWSLAVLNYPHPELMGKLVSSFCARDLRTMPRLEIINCLWAFAKLEKRDRPTLRQKLHQELPIPIYNAPKFPLQFWAVAILLNRGTNVKDGNDKAKFILQGKQWLQMQHESLSSIQDQLLVMEGLAKFKFDDPVFWSNFFTHVLCPTLTRPPEAINIMDISVLSSMALTCGILELKSARKVLSLISKQICQRSENEVTMRSLVQLPFSWARCGHDNTNDDDVGVILTVLHMLAQRPQDEFNQLEHRLFFQTFASIGQLGYQNRQLMTKLTKGCLHRHPCFSDVATVLTCMDQVSFASDQVISELANHCLTMPTTEFEGKSLPRILRGFAVLDILNPEIKHKLCTSLALHLTTLSSRNNNSYGAEDWILMLWSFACLNGLDYVKHLIPVRLPSLLTVAAAAKGDKDSLSVAAQHQVFQLELAWKNQPKSEQFTPLRMTEVTVSPVQVQIFNRIQTMVMEKVELEHVVLQNMAVDIFLPSRNLVVEVNGPFHYLQLEEEGKRVNGTTRFKQRLLEEAGFKVISIDSEEYKQLDSEQQVVFLQQALWNPVG